MKEVGIATWHQVGCLCWNDLSNKSITNESEVSHHDFAKRHQDD
jgi:hypothetical protein